MRRPGETVAGRYRLERRLGAGGMSTVYLAVDDVLERQVAIKLLAEHLSEDKAFLTRFRNEARSAARLTHPNVVQVYDTGEEEGRHFIVMEYVRGKSGAQLLRERGNLPIDEAVRLASQACDGLRYAHSKGIVHRDVKPGNLLIAEDGTVKIADFGIAKAAEQTRVTKAGSVLGTAAYISPEQAHGKEATPASDIYSLGVVVYQFLSGRLPYEYSSITELALKQQSQEIKPLPSIAKKVPEGLDHAVRRALARNPENRYADAGEMAVALRSGASGEAVAPPEPDEAATQLLPAEEEAPATAATLAIPAARGRPSEGTAPTAKAAGGRAGRKKSRAGRYFLTLLVLALIGGGAAVAVIATSDSQQGREFQQVLEDTVQDQTQGLKDLIRENTR